MADVTMASHAGPGAEMPFLDHLEELRWRLLYSLAALVVGVVVAFVVLTKYDVLGALARPILPYLPDHRLVYTHPGDMFSITLTSSFAIGLLLALPVILYQAWSFLAPALYAHEKRVAVPAVAFAVVLFAAGVSLAFFVVLPLAISWLMGFQTAAAQPMITASEYFNFAVTMCLAFGLCFELPIVILVLTWLGILTPQLLVRFRRHAVIACVVAGAFLTPGDLIWTTIAMTVPLYFLYELSVALSFVVHKRQLRARRAALEDETPA